MSGNQPAPQKKTGFDGYFVFEFARGEVNFFGHDIPFAQMVSDRSRRRIGAILRLRDLYLGSNFQADATIANELAGSIEHRLRS